MEYRDFNSEDCFFDEAQFLGDGGAVYKILPELVTEKYGVRVYRSPNALPRAYDLYIVNGSKIIGLGGYENRLHNGKRYYHLDRESSTTYEPDWDRIISRGIADCLLRCNDLENLIGFVPAEIWKEFPALLPFITEYHSKLLLERGNSEVVVRLECNEKIRTTDFRTSEKTRMPYYGKRIQKPANTNSNEQSCGKICAF